LLRFLGYIFLIIATAGLTGVLSFGWLAQGMIGQIVGNGLSSLLTYWGTLLFLLVFIAITVTFTFDLHWHEILSGQAIRSRLHAEATDEEETNTEFKATAQEASQAKPNDTAQLPLPLASHDTEQTAYDSSHLADNEDFVGSPLDAFLDETGFSEIKDYEWLEENDATNPFKPVTLLALSPGASDTSKRVTTGPICALTTSALILNSCSLISNSADSCCNCSRL
jgi:DNA segregation ATPase FtsK/SpoIIIE, S-DNA-T family